MASLLSLRFLFAQLSLRNRPHVPNRAIFLVLYGAIFGYRFSDTPEIWLLAIVILFMCTITIATAILALKIKYIYKK